MRYLDTSSLVALYCPEAKTARTIAHIERQHLPFALTWLHEVEFTNGLQLKLFRKEAAESAVSAALRALRADVEAGVLQRTPISWPAVFETSLRLSTAHSRAAGTRTLDLLHVAAAIALQATEFITGDKRQAKVATKEGLKVITI